MNILVLAGGLSPERDVSWSSGNMIADALVSAGHEVLLLDLYEGIDGREEDLAGLFRRGGDFSVTVPEREPDLAALIRQNGGRTEPIGPNVLKLCRLADVVFIALHGAMGENGQLQAALDCFGVRYTGTGFTGCLLAMDKDISKKLMRFAGIDTADWIMFDSDSDDMGRIETEIGFPCVVKPSGCGSSVGVSIVEQGKDLEEALGYAKKYESVVLVEKKITGREFSVGILGGQALPVIEIIPRTGFYDYKNKYQAGLTDEPCPADLSAALTEKVQKLALAVHKILRLGGYSRVDFIMDRAGRFFCLEANTLPGMTPTSLLPKEAEQAGIRYQQLCERICLLPFPEQT